MKPRPRSLFVSSTNPFRSISKNVISFLREVISQASSVSSANVRFLLVRGMAT